MWEVLRCAESRGPSSSLRAEDGSGDAEEGARAARPPGACSLEEGRDSTGDRDGDLLRLDKELGTRGVPGRGLYAWCSWGVWRCLAKAL